MDMHKVLPQFNATIDKWIAYLDDYTLTMLCQKPRPAAWSLGQVYLHVIADTGYFIGEIKTALLLKNVNHEQEMHPDAKAIFAQQGFSDSLFSNPSNDPDSPQPDSKAALRQGLLSIKEAINQCCATADFYNAHGKTQHPGLGYFSAAEWLQFAEMHMRHHLRQKKRIDEALFSASQPGK